jgi:hypothetical protein
MGRYFLVFFVTKLSYEYVLKILSIRTAWIKFPLALDKK